MLEEGACTQDTRLLYWKPSCSAHYQKFWNQGSNETCSHNYGNLMSAAVSQWFHSMILCCCNSRVTNNKDILIWAPSPSHSWLLWSNTSLGCSHIALKFHLNPIPRPKAVGNVNHRQEPSNLATWVQWSDPSAVPKTLWNCLVLCWALTFYGLGNSWTMWVNTHAQD